MRDVFFPIPPKEIDTWPHSNINVLLRDNVLTIATASNRVEIMHSIDPIHIEKTYQDGYVASENTQNEKALEYFTAAAITQGPIIPSLYALAVQFAYLKRNKEAAAISSFIAELPMQQPPYPAALAGYTYDLLSNVDISKKFLVLAARRSRGSQEFSNVQKLCQKTLLKQAFGDGGKR